MHESIRKLPNGTRSMQITKLYVSHWWVTRRWLESNMQKKTITCNISTCTVLVWLWRPDIQTPFGAPNI